MAKSFSDAINEIMPLVNDGDTSTPFIISRNPGDADSPWIAEYPYPAENAGERFLQRLESDPYAVAYRGADFDGGSFSYVHDKVLSDTLRNEYYEIVHTSADKEALSALINFFEDNVGEFSKETTAYLTTLDKPFAELIKICPFNMATGREGWLFNESLAPDAVDHIENAVFKRLHPDLVVTWPNEAVQTATERDGGQNNAGSSEVSNDAKSNDNDKAHIISSLLLDGATIELGENAGQETPYYVECNRDGENLFSFRTDNYAEAIKTYSGQILDRAYEMGIDRDGKAAAFGVEYVKLTDAECLPDSKNADFTGKLIIVDANALQPEYRSSTNQLMQCTHGNGARPDAIGTSVFGKELYSGESVVYGRHQILGVADEEKLPQWAKTKLEIQRDPAVFEFRGFHFKPYRNFKYGEVDRQLEGDSRLWKTDASYQFRNMASDHDMKPLKSENMHTEFYGVANNSADIFVCVENGKLYVPCASELFLYNEPSEKELRIAENKALKEYGNVIDAAIQEGVEQKSVPHTLEVLDARFGKALTDELLATVALTSLKDDGRISNSRREWAKSVIGDTDGLKTIIVRSHPAHFDNLMMYAVQRDAPEQAKSELEQVKSAHKAEKPDFLGKINDNKRKVERDKADAPAPAKKKKRDGQEV